MPYRCPSREPIRLIDDAGHAADRSLTGGFALPDARDALELLYRRMVLARRFDVQVTALTRQGRLATYPSASARRRCEIGATLALEPTRLAVPHLPRQHRGAHPRGRARRDAAPVPRRLALRLRPARAPHQRRRPRRWRPRRCTPSGVAHAARLRHDPIVALAFVGDGATSEGDAHEAFNFAGGVAGAGGVRRAEQPVRHQRAARPADRAPALADKGVGYGMPGVPRRRQRRRGGVRGRLGAAVDTARAGGGPTLIEASPTGSRRTPTPTTPPATATPREVEPWKGRDPIERLEKYLRLRAACSATRTVRPIAAEAEELAAAHPRRHERPRPSSTRWSCSTTSTRPTRPSLLEQRACSGRASWPPTEAGRR